MKGGLFFHETYGRNAKKRIKDVAKIFQNTLTVQNGHMTDSDINLLGPSESNTLVTGYELGNIFSIEYSAKHLPSNEIMKQDLADMLASLKAVKNSLIDDTNIEQSVEYILSVNDRQTLYLDKADKKTAKDLTEVDLVETEAPATKEKTPNRGVSKRQGRKLDYAQGQQNNSELGFFGEKAVLKFEKERLHDHPELVEKIEHVSVTQGDGLGYDILSFDEDGNELYIEVKTTKQGEETPFYISSNEVDFARTHPENYVLYRLYNVDKVKMNESDVKFFKIDGKSFGNLTLSPTNYQASF
ncbi:MrcB family domain-containing protein [Fructobacillus pseudoficulneus]|nr:DUF3578 domain-containing protein [Fructobacillus pseudoficulneus]